VSEHGRYSGSPWSIEHWTDVALGSTVKPNVGEVSFVGPDGPESIVTAGPAADADAASASMRTSVSAAAANARR
jgi:hypothetical protein